MDALELSATAPASCHRVVTHIDLDCFYAQVEAKRLGIDPSVPLAVQQWSNLIAVNYPARALGVSRHMRAADAVKLCPQVKLVHVETLDASGRARANAAQATDKASLRRYREASFGIFEVLVRIMGPERVQKAGCDEAFLDLTSAVDEVLRTGRLPAAFRTAAAAAAAAATATSAPPASPAPTATATAAAAAEAEAEAEEPGAKRRRTESGAMSIHQQHQHEAEAAAADTQETDDHDPSAPPAVAATTGAGATTSNTAAATAVDERPYASPTAILAAVYAQPEFYIVSASGGPDIRAIEEAAAVNSTSGGSSGSGRPPALDPSSVSDVRIAVGALLAQVIRRAVLAECGYTCGAGVGHNKMLAKLGSARNKPAKQTLMPARAVPLLMRELKLRKIRFLGGKLGALLVAEVVAAGIVTIADVRKHQQAKDSAKLKEKEAGAGASGGAGAGSKAAADQSEQHDDDDDSGSENDGGGSDSDSEGEGEGDEQEQGPEAYAGAGAGGGAAAAAASNKAGSAPQVGINQVSYKYYSISVTNPGGSTGAGVSSGSASSSGAGAGAGAAAVDVTAAQDFVTAGHAQALPLPTLRRVFGEATGTWAYRIVRGIDDSPVTAYAKPKSLMAAKSFAPADCATGRQCCSWLRMLCAELAQRLESDERMFHRQPRTLVLHYRRDGRQVFEGKSKSGPMPPRPRTTDALLVAAAGLLKRAIEDEGVASSSRMAGPIPGIGLSSTATATASAGAAAAAAAAPTATTTGAGGTAATATAAAPSHGGLATVIFPCSRFMLTASQFIDYGGIGHGGGGHGGGHGGGGGEGPGALTAWLQRNSNTGNSGAAVDGSSAAAQVSPQMAAASGSGSSSKRAQPLTGVQRYFASSTAATASSSGHAANKQVQQQEVVIDADDDAEDAVAQTAASTAAQAEEAEAKQQQQHEKEEGEEDGEVVVVVSAAPDASPKRAAASAARSSPSHARSTAGGSSSSSSRAAAPAPAAALATAVSGVKRSRDVAAMLTGAATTSRASGSANGKGGGGGIGSAGRAAGTTTAAAAVACPVCGAAISLQAAAQHVENCLQTRTSRR